MEEVVPTLFRISGLSFHGSIEMRYGAGGKGIHFKARHPAFGSQCHCSVLV